MRIRKTNETIMQSFMRWCFFIIGLIVLALGISLTIQAKELGIGPWDVFHYGLFLKLGLTIGTWSIIAGLTIILATSLVTKTLPQLGTFINMLLIGGFIDFFNWVLQEPVTMMGQWFVFVAGVIILGYGIGLYVAADLGAGPRDSLMIVVTEYTGWKVQWVRNGMEMIVLMMGWMLGGPVGIGTVIIAFLLGPIVGYSLPQSKMLLQMILKRGQRHENLNEGSLRPDGYDGISKKLR